MRRIARSIASAAWLAALPPAPAAPADEPPLPGPIPAVVERVVDGDTLDVKARIWLDQTVVARVRLAGVDTPELSGDCDEERAAARRARAFVEARIGPAVRLYEVRRGRYGRAVARVVTAEGADLAALLIATGLGRPYDGGRRAGWC